MQDVLHMVFSWVCGQQMAHTWSPGGLPLPCCQRCTGLYTGACVAGLLHLWIRPSLNPRFLKAHGLMLLLMVPLGFHWVAQGPLVRGASGVLFGAGAFTFLWLPIAGSPAIGEHRPGRQVAYGVAIGLITIGVSLLADWGGRWSSWLLTGLSTAGVISLAGVVTGAMLVWLKGLRHSCACSAARSDRL